jgi:hypothetical protein
VNAPDYNAHYAAVSGHGILPSDLGAASWADIAAIATWQKAHGLTADGQFGPRSVKAYQVSKKQPPPKQPVSGKLAFVQSITAAAAKECPKHGIPPQVCVAQAILESGWGKAAAGFNCFGIKGSGDAGTQVWKTREFLGGQWITIDDHFAKYSSFEAAVAAYCALLQKGRYKGAIGAFGHDPARFISYVWSSGYATAPNYPSYVCGVMRAAGKLTGDPTYNVTIDAPLEAVIGRMKAVAFGKARMKVRDEEMKTLFRMPSPPAIVHADSDGTDDPTCADASAMCLDDEDGLTA